MYSVTRVVVVRRSIYVSFWLIFSFPLQYDFSRKKKTVPSNCYLHLAYLFEQLLLRTHTVVEYPFISSFLLPPTAIDSPRFPNDKRRVATVFTIRLFFEVYVGAHRVLGVGVHKVYFKLVSSRIIRYIMSQYRSPSCSLFMLARI